MSEGWAETLPMDKIATAGYQATWFGYLWFKSPFFSSRNLVTMAI